MDERDFFAQSLGPSEIKSADSTTGAAFTLKPGRYRVAYRSVVTATTIWAELKATPGSALAAAPATPFDVAAYPGELFKVTIARPPFTRTGETGGKDAAADTLYFKTNAGTVDIIVTKISRD